MCVVSYIFALIFIIILVWFFYKGFTTVNKFVKNNNENNK